VPDKWSFNCCFDIETRLSWAEYPWHISGKWFDNCIVKTNIEISQTDFVFRNYNGKSQ